MTRRSSGVGILRPRAHGRVCRARAGRWFSGVPARVGGREGSTLQRVERRLRAPWRGRNGRAGDHAESIVTHRNWPRAARRRGGAAWAVDAVAVAVHSPGVL